MANGSMLFCASGLLNRNTISWYTVACCLGIGTQ